MTLLLIRETRRLRLLTWLTTWRTISLGVAATVTPTMSAWSQPPSRDTLAIVQTVMRAEEQFLRAWRTAWLKSDWDAWTALDRSTPRNTNPRYAPEGMQQLWCVYAWKPPVGVESPTRRSRMIPSGTAAVPTLLCPSWVVDPLHTNDASTVLDSALSPARRDSIALQRDSILALIDRAAERLPGDRFLLGQRIRFRVDQAYRDHRRLDEALALAQGCTIDAWWCASLEGFVHARGGRLDSASAAFARARRAAPETLRCQLDNVVSLVDRRVAPLEADTVRTWDCREHAAFAERLWWLSDPLWSDSINERRVEHDVRTVALLLSAALRTSERFDWTSEADADAAAQLVTRYGWPAIMHWSRLVQSRRVGSREIRFVHGRDPITAAPSPPFTTQEYAVNRIRVTPSWAALLHPFRATTGDWELTAPADVPFREWWPPEHFRRERPLVALSDWQLGVWRRGDSVLVAAATAPPRAWHESSRVSAALVASTAPSTFVRVAEGQTTRNEPIRMSGRRAADAALLSLELCSVSAGDGDARVRFALPYDSSLFAPPARVAISSPVLLMTTSRTLPETAEEIVPLLLPGTVVTEDKSVGLYWETYGLQETDSVETTLQVERLDARGVFERIGVLFSGGRSDLAGTQIRWWTPRPGASIPSAQGDPASFGRSLAINLSDLRPGQYAITVSVRAADGRSASAYRLFTLGSTAPVQ